MKDVFRINNFDLIRLIAALQVAVLHSVNHLGVTNSTLAYKLIKLFPGVPIFFFISGYLISKSYENNSSLNEYIRNRALRIYPGLIVCTFFAFSSVYLLGYLSNMHMNFLEIVCWLIGQITIVQFYNPSFMRDFGTGVLNGSLWTITVELQFYILIPILYRAIIAKKTGSSNVKLLMLIILFAAVNVMHNFSAESLKDFVLFRMWSVSFLPWLYMFLVGILFQRNFNTLHKLLSGKVAYLLPLYIATAYVSIKYLDVVMGNAINPLFFILLVITIFSIAYSYPMLSKSVLRGNDISYGVYIYHIPIINIFMYCGFVKTTTNFILVIFLTTLFAILSWLIIEKQSIKFKIHPLNPLN